MENRIVDMENRIIDLENRDMQHLHAWETEHAHARWGGAVPIENIASKLIPGARVLDAGCGKGRYLLPFSKQFICTGLDVSFTALKTCRDSLRKRSRDAGTVLSTMTHMPFKADSFDSILCHGVLQHLLEKERTEAINEVQRVLVPGGLLFLEVFGVDDMRYGGEEAEPHTFRRNSGIIYHYFSKGELEKLFRDMEVVELTERRYEKKFKGQAYTRHMIQATIRKI